MTDGLRMLLESLSEGLLPIGLRGALLLSMAGVASLLLRRAPAAVRHLVWLGASVGLLLLPAAGSVVPRWSLPVPEWLAPAEVPAARMIDRVNGGSHGTAVSGGSHGTAASGGSHGTAASGDASSRDAAVRPEPVDAGGVHVAHGRIDAGAAVGALVAGETPQSAPQEMAGGTAAGGGSAAAASRGSASSATAGIAAAVGVRGSAGPTPPSAPGRSGGAPADASFPLAPVLVGLWAAGALALLASLARSLVAVRRLERAARPFPAGRVTDEAARLGERLGLRETVRLLEGPADAMPLSWGIRSGVVLLPEGAERWHPERLRSVLLHELAHVRRGDCLTQLVAEVARAIHWLDPLAWLAVRRLRVEREHACDDRVLAAGAAPAVYASELLSLARGFRARPRAARAAVAMAGASSLETRLRAVLDERRQRTLSRARATGVSALALLATLALAGAAPAVAKAEAESAGVDANAESVTADARAEPVTGDARAEPAPSEEVTVPPVTVEPFAVEPVRIGASAAQESTCGLATSGWNRHSHSIDDDDHRLEWSRSGCSVDVRVEGDVEFTPDFRDVARMGRGARLRIEEEEGRTERVLELTPGAGGRPEYDYEIDGDAQAFDATARAWYEAMLLQVFRNGGLMAEERVGALLASGGVPAVLDELEMIPADFVFATYVEELLRQATLDDERALALMARARERVDSDHYLAGILEVLADREPLSDRVLAGMLEASNGLDSDHYRAGVLGRALNRGDLSREHRAELLRSAAAMDSDHYTAEILEELGRRYALEPELRADYLRTVSAMDSDHYRASVLSSLMSRNDLQAGEIATVLQAAGDMDSDHYIGGVLEEVAGRGLDSPELRDAYFDVAARMDSDHYRSAALHTLLEGDRLSGELVRRLIEATAGIDSDHYKSGLLVDIAERYPLEGAAREAYMQAMESIDSSHSRGQVAEALLRQGRSG